MTKVLSTIVFLSSLNVCASEWMPLPGYDLHELYSGGMAIGTDIKRETEIIGTNGLSWPDGRQALITTIEIRQLGSKGLYRCMQYFSADMQQTGERCYELHKKLTPNSTSNPTQ